MFVFLVAPLTRSCDGPFPQSLPTLALTDITRASSGGGMHGRAYASSVGPLVEVLRGVAIEQPLEPFPRNLVLLAQSGLSDLQCRSAQ